MIFNSGIRQGKKLSCRIESIRKNRVFSIRQELLFITQKSYKGAEPYE